MASPTQRPNDDPASDAALLLIRLGLVLLAFAVPISAVVSRRALFILLPVGTGLLLVAATLLPRPRVAQRVQTLLTGAAGIATVGLVAWCALSIVWTPFALAAAERLGKEAGTLLLVVATIVLMPERTRTSNLYLFPLGLVLAAAAIFVAACLGPKALGEFQDADSKLDRAVISLVMLVWPSLGALAVRERWISAGWLAVGITLAAMAASTPITLASLALGAIAFAIATINPTVVGRLFGVIVALIVLGGPLWPVLSDPWVAGFADAVGDRLPALFDIAQSVHVWAELVIDEPLRLITGHGFDMAARASSTGFLPPQVPHSLLFEVWYDLGTVGAVACAVLAYGGFAAAGRSSPTVAPFLLAEIVSGLVISGWDPEVSQTWWITLLGVAGVAFATVVRAQYRTARPAAHFAPGLGKTEPSLN